MPAPCLAGPGQRQGAVLKGFFSGLLWGGVLGAIGLVILSEITLMPATATGDPVQAPQADLAQPDGTAAAPVLPAPQPDVQAGTGEKQATPSADPSVLSQPGQTPAAVAEAGQVSPGSEVNRALPDEAPTLPGVEPAPAPGLTPKVDAPGQGGALPDTNTEPGSAPAPPLISPEAGTAPDTAVAGVAVPEPQPGIAPQAAAPAPDAPAVEAVPDMADLPPPPPLTPEEQALVNKALETLPEDP